jgi:RNA polymerase sigma factor (sigma-70 family)
MHKLNIHNRRSRMLSEIKHMNKPAQTEELFAKIYTENFNKVYTFSFRIVGDMQLAEDITQDTFIQAFNNLESFRNESAISTWILSIARNICYRQMRKARRSSFRSIEKLIDTKSASYHETPDGILEKKFYTDQVRDGCLLGLLRCLSFYQRCAFILNLLNDIEMSIVAGIIGKSENSTRILVHRARRNLKNFLCDNCSLYNKENKCRCENLVEFSLQKGWIQKFNSSVPFSTVSRELSELKNEIAIYKTIENSITDKTLAERCTALINNPQSIIFSDKKVK